MAIISAGVGASSGNIGANVNMRDVESQLMREWKDLYPLVLLMNRAKASTRQVHNREFEVFEEAEPDFQTQINNGAGYSDSATSIVVDDASMITPNDLIKIVRTGEQLLVTAVNYSTHTLTTTSGRAFGTTAAAAIVDNDYVQLLGSAFQEGGDNTNINLPIWTRGTNYTQLLRRLTSVTNQQQKHRPYVGDARRNYQKTALNRLLKQLEYQLLLGQKKIDSSTADQPRTSTAGVVTQITTNVKDASAGFTERWFLQNVAEPIFDYGGEERLAFCSPRVISLMTEWGLARLRGTEAETKHLGLKNLLAYMTPHGPIYLKRHRLLRGNTYSNYMVVTDPSCFRLAVLEDLRLDKNVQYGNQHKQSDEWVFNGGLDMWTEKAFALVTNAAA